jgi:hypothetical protein
MSINTSDYAYEIPISKFKFRDFNRILRKFLIIYEKKVGNIRILGACEFEL